jgi:hypothetical protein
MITNDNKEEQKITKSNGSTSSTSVASPTATVSQEVLPLEEALASGDAVKSEPAPVLDRSMIERAMITFFDNGETAKQRYKIAIRINLKDVSSQLHPEFIAPLTKDGRSFRRYSAPGTRDDLIDFHNELRIHVKQQGVDNKPYFGKFHLNHKNWGEGQNKIQVEPLSYASVWYDGEGWSGVIKLYDFVLPFDLFTNSITKRQSLLNVKSTYLWQNPKYERTQRPLTWAQKRALK